MNILREPILSLITKFGELEGLPWVESTFRKSQYSMLGALHWLDKLRAEATAEANRLTKEGYPRDWSTIFAEQLQEHSYEIYGDGGWNRYYVDGRGHVRFSKFHSTTDKQIRAAELGFDVR